MSHRIDILGVPFRPMTEEQTRQEITELLKRRGNARIFTPNPDILMKARKDQGLRESLRGADLLLPDGVGVILASRLLRTPLPQRITGIDTAEWLLSVAEKNELSVYLLGGKRGVAEEAARRMKARFPDLRIVGSHHGYFDKRKDSRENRRVVARIRSAAPDLLFVCFGCPAQEKWMEENTPTLPSLRLSMGLGGCLDVWSGQKKRAPNLFQRTGTEWLFRALREPRRFSSLLRAPLFLWATVTERNK